MYVRACLAQAPTARAYDKPCAAVDSADSTAALVTVVVQEVCGYLSFTLRHCCTYLLLERILSLGFGLLLRHLDLQAPCRLSYGARRVHGDVHRSAAPL